MIFNVITGDNFQTAIPQRTEKSDVLDPIDQNILHEIEACGCYGENPWKVLGRVASKYNPESREDARALRLKLWEGLKRLMKMKQVHRYNRKYVTTKLRLIPYKKRRRMQRIYRLPSVAQNVSITPGSTIKPNPSAKRVIRIKPADPKPLTAKPKFPGGMANLAKTKSVYAYDEVSAAARALSKLPRLKTRKWTGYIGRERVFRDREVMLADGTIAFVFGVRRKKAVITLDRGKLRGGFREPENPLRWFVTDSENVQLRVNPAAQLLGHQKRGKKERYSLRKAEAARQNGTKPPRPGSKPRGRPKNLLSG